LLSIIQAAGWPIWPLILCSIVALALVIERFMSLQPRKVAPPNAARRSVGVTRDNLPSPDVVINKLESQLGAGRCWPPAARVINANPRITEEATLRQAFENAGRAAVHGLERYLNALGTIASAAPLLGLLGTVIGMIEIFGSQAPTGGATRSSWRTASRWRCTTPPSA
jgi:biopolymer transport protein ExbB